MILLPRLLPIDKIIHDLLGDISFSGASSGLLIRREVLSQMFEEVSQSLK